MKNKGAGQKNQGGGKRVKLHWMKTLEPSDRKG